MSTPGPWEIYEKKDTFNIEAGKRCIARLQKKVGAEADANLIVIAPDLFNALKICANALKDAENTGSPIHMMNENINALSVTEFCDLIIESATSI